MALTSDQRAMIEAEVKIWMDAERMFTAFEISRAVKAKGIGLRHREMKRDVHDAISARRSRSYTRTMTDVGAPEQAWLYHPISKNPFQFNALQRGDHSGTVAANYRPRNPISLADDGDNDPIPSGDGIYGCDNEGHLKLPAKEMAKIGVAANEKVHVVGDPAHHNVAIGKPAELDSDGAEVQQTNDNGDLVLDHETLEFVDLDWLPCYKIEVVDKTIVVSDAS